MQNQLTWQKMDRGQPKKMEQPHLKFRGRNVLNLAQSDALQKVRRQPDASAISHHQGSSNRVSRMNGVGNLGSMISYGSEFFEDQFQPHSRQFNQEYMSPTRNVRPRSCVVGQKRSMPTHHRFLNAGGQDSNSMVGFNPPAVSGSNYHNSYYYCQDENKASFTMNPNQQVAGSEHISYANPRQDFFPYQRTLNQQVDLSSEGLLTNNERSDKYIQIMKNGMIHSQANPDQMFSPNRYQTANSEIQIDPMQPSNSQFGPTYSKAQSPAAFQNEQWEPQMYRYDNNLGQQSLQEVFPRRILKHRQGALRPQTTRRQRHEGPQELEMVHELEQNVRQPIQQREIHDPMIQYENQGIDDVYQQIPVKRANPKNQVQAKKLFGGRNMNIKSKSRQANATMTAFHLLESALFIDHPALMEEHTAANNTLQEEQILKAQMNCYQKQPIMSARIVQPKKSLISPKGFQNLNKDFRDQGIISHRDVPNQEYLALSPKIRTVSNSASTKPPTSYRQQSQQRATFQPQPLPLRATMEDESQKTSLAKPKVVKKIRKVREVKKETLVQKKEEEQNNFNERLKLLLDKATKKQEELEKQIELQKGTQRHGQNAFLPMFSSNHIQNLTINAQPGFNIGELSQVTQGGSQPPIKYEIEYGNEKTQPQTINLKAVPSTNSNEEDSQNKSIIKLQKIEQPSEEQKGSPQGLPNKIHQEEKKPDPKAISVEESKVVQPKVPDAKQQELPRKIEKAQTLVPKKTPEEEIKSPNQKPTFAVEPKQDGNSYLQLPTRIRTQQFKSSNTMGAGHTITIQEEQCPSLSGSSKKSNSKKKRSKKKIVGQKLEKRSGTLELEHNNKFGDEFNHSHIQSYPSQNFNMNGSIKMSQNLSYSPQNGSTGKLGDDCDSRDLLMKLFQEKLMEIRDPSIKKKRQLKKIMGKAIDGFMYIQQKKKQAQQRRHSLSKIFGNGYDQPERTVYFQPEERKAAVSQGKRTLSPKMNRHYMTYQKRNGNGLSEDSSQLEESITMSKKESNVKVNPVQEVEQLESLAKRKAPGPAKPSSSKSGSYSNSQSSKKERSQSQNLTQSEIKLAKGVSQKVLQTLKSPEALKEDKENSKSRDASAQSQENKKEIDITNLFLPQEAPIELKQINDNSSCCNDCDESGGSKDDLAVPERVRALKRGSSQISISCLEPEKKGKPDLRKVSSQNLSVQRQIEQSATPPIIMVNLEFGQSNFMTAKQVERIKNDLNRILTEEAVEIENATRKKFNFQKKVTKRQFLQTETMFPEGFNTQANKTSMIRDNPFLLESDSPETQRLVGLHHHQLHASYANYTENTEAEYNLMYSNKENRERQYKDRVLNFDENARILLNEMEMLCYQINLNMVTEFPPLVLKRNRYSSELGAKLIELYDINMKYISKYGTNNRKKLMIKFNRQKSMLFNESNSHLENDPLFDHEQSEYQNNKDPQSFESIFPNRRLIINYRVFEDLEINFKNTVAERFPETQTKKAKRNQVTFPVFKCSSKQAKVVFRSEGTLFEVDEMMGKLDHRATIEKQAMQFNARIERNDNEWRERMNKKCFIILTNPAIIDQNPRLRTQNFSLYQIKENTNKLDMLDQVNWHMIENEIIKHNKYHSLKSLQYQIHKQNERDESLIKLIDKFLKFPPAKFMIKKYYPELNKKIFIKIHPGVLSIIESKCIKMPKLHSYNYTDLFGFIKQKFILHIDDHVWSHRFEPLLKYYKFREDFKKSERLQQTQLNILNDMNLQSNFSDHLAFHVIKPSRNFHDILFMHTLNSLYYNLYDVDQDYRLYFTIEKLCSLSKSFQSKKSSQLSPRRKMSEYKPLQLSNKALRALVGSGKKFMEDLMSETGTSIFNERISDPALKAPPLKPKIQRQNALNKFNLKCCEYKVLISLETTIMKVKDRVTLFYKRIETQLKKEDGCMTISEKNRVMLNYGYKSVLIRDENNKYVMEIYLPIMISKGAHKLQQRQKYLQNPVSLKEQLEMQQKEIDQHSQIQNSKYINNQMKKNQMFKAIFVEELHTDDSMKEIQFEHLISNSESSNNQSSDNKEENEDENCLLPRQVEQQEEENQRKQENRKKHRQMKEKLEKYQQVKMDETFKKMSSMAIHRKRFNKEMQLNTSAIDHYKQLNKARKREHSKEKKDQPEIEQQSSHGKFLKDQSNNEAMQFLEEQEPNADKIEVQKALSFFKILTQEEEEAISISNKNYLKSLKNKYNVDAFIERTLKKVRQDNTKQSKEIEGQLQRILAERNDIHQSLVENEMKLRQLSQLPATPRRMSSASITKKLQKQNVPNLDKLTQMASRKNQHNSLEYKNYYVEVQKLKRQTRNLEKKEERMKRQFQILSKNKQLIKHKRSYKTKSSKIDFDPENKNKRRMTFNLNQESDGNAIKDGMREFFIKEMREYQENPKKKKAEEVKGAPSQSFSDQELVKKNKARQVMQNTLVQELFTQNIKNVMNLKIGQEMIKKKTVLDLKKFQSESSHEDEFCKNMSEDEEAEDLENWTEEMYFNKKKEEILQELRKNKFQKENHEDCQHLNSENMFSILNRSKSDCKHNVGAGSMGQISNRGEVDQNISSELFNFGSSPAKSQSLSPDKTKGIQINENFQLIIEVAKVVNDEQVRKKGLGQLLPQSMNDENSEKVQRSQKLSEFRLLEKQQQNEFYIQKMRDSIEQQNIGLMEDVLNRYLDNLNSILDEDGNSLIHLAVLHGDANMLNILLSKGVNPNMQNKVGNTALHYATMKHRHKCVDALIQYGVNERLENNEGKTPWMMKRTIWENEIN